MLGEVERTDVQVSTGADGELESAPVSQMDENEGPKLIDENDEESDDEPIIRRRRPSKMNRSLLEDSDSEDDAIVSDPTKSPVRKSRPVIADSDSGSEDEEIGSVSRKDEDLDDKGPTLNKEDEEDALIEKPGMKTTTLNDNIFDSEMGGSSEEDNRSSDEDDVGVSQKEDGPASSNDEDDEDGISVKEISSKLKKRLAKGAAKKPSSSRSGGGRASAKEALTQIHSESQRLVRESRVQLPYHKPEPIGLSVFLQRSKHKQERLQALHAPPGRSWKVAPADLIVTPRLTPPAESQVGKEKQTTSQSVNPKSSNAGTAISVEKTMLKAVDCDNSVENKGDENPKSVAENSPIDMLIDDDNLPDLVIETEPNVAKVTELTSDTKTNCVDTAANDKGDVDMTENVQSDETSNKAKDSLKKPEQDSGYLTTPAVSSEEENSHDNKSPGDSPAIEEKHDVEGSGTNSPLPSTGSKTPGGKGITKHTALTPKLASLQMMTSLKPKLTGGPSDFIDFDDEDEAPKKPSGVHSLMDRFMKHSFKRPKKHSQDVELSLVTKVKDENDREQLTLEKMTVHVDGDEEEEDPKDARPGARMSKLKEKLKAAMNAKRAVARQQRIQMAELDNEEGFEEEEEEEEMTESEEEEEEEGEEEEMDEEEYSTAEKEKEKNPFLEDEADVEDDADEEHLHLELDTLPNSKENSDGEDEAASTRKPSRDFLKSAFEKTKTMDLFDDDAISDSPTMSQESTKTVIELSERPFEKLSGEASRTIDEDDIDRLLDAGSSDAGDKSKESGEGSSVNTSLADDVSSLGLLGRDRDNSFSSVDTSFDIMSSQIPAGQRTGGKRRSLLDGRGTPELFSPSSKSSIGTVSTNRSTKKNRGRLSSLAMPIEDSQDLLAASPSSRTESTPRIGSSSFHFALDDSTNNSQLLDADGLFKEGSTGKKHTRRQLMMFNKDCSSHEETDDDLLALCSGKFTADSQAQDTSSKPMFRGVSQMDSGSQGDMNELLGLCSGQFTGTKKSSDVPLIMDDNENDQNASQGGMDELLGLCSGRFTAQADSPPGSPAGIIKKSTKRRPVIEDDDEDDFEMADGPCADEDGDGDNEDGLSSDEDAGNEDDEDDEEMQQAKALSQFKGFVKGKKHGKFRQEFVEEEAELSGSEGESDEDLDIDLKDDFLEAESGDEDVLSDEELRDQVGRAHLKALIDEDKRKLRLFQEAYLADGDLHSDGNGRTRKFRWKNIDEDTQQDMFVGSDEEKEEEDHDGEKWRRERHEREKFLQEQQKEEKDKTDAGSELFKLGKVVLKPKKVLRPIQESNKLPEVEKDKGKMKPPEPPKNLFKVPNRRGSLLNRGKDTLAKIAEMNKTVANIMGPKHSKNFVFSSMSQEEKEEGDDKKPKPVRRSVSCASSTQPAKRPRLERSNTIPPDSIFNFMK